MTDERVELPEGVTSFGQLSTEQALNRLGARIAELQGMTVAMSAALGAAQGMVSEIYVSLSEGG